MQNAIANAVSGGVNPGIEIIVKELNVIVKLQKDIRGPRPASAFQGENSLCRLDT
jgi:hypothetical protein